MRTEGKKALFVSAPGVHAHLVHVRTCGCLLHIWKALANLSGSHDTFNPLNAKNNLEMAKLLYDMIESWPLGGTIPTGK